MYDYDRRKEEWFLPTVYYLNWILVIVVRFCCVPVDDKGHIFPKRTELRYQWDAD